MTKTPTTTEPGVLVYEHPQGKTIHVYPNGSMDVFKPDGKRGTSSATPAKLAAGYGGWVLRSGSAPAAPIPELTKPSTETASVTAMTYHEINFADVKDMIMDEDVAVEQKLDGTRAIVVVTGGRVAFFGRNGQPLKHAAAAAHFSALRPGLSSLKGSHILDGEIISETGELWLFDLPESTYGRGVEPADPLHYRRACLELVGANLTTINPKIRVVPHAIDMVEKAKLLVAVEQSGGEGIMLKKRSAPYEGGVRVKHSVKVKFVKTADLVVMDRDTKGKKNATLGVWNPATGVITAVGACSMIGKDDAIIGDVVEVAYLNWTGTKLYQPRFIKIRDDKTPQDCLMEQFPEYSKAVVE